MARADTAAAELLSRFGIVAPPVDTQWLAAQLGVIVIPEKMTSDVSGMLLRGEDQNVIGVNADHAPVRQRFTVAHELGHLLLHRGRPLILDTGARVSINRRDGLSSTATDREEIEANRFAAALLAPEKMVRQEVRRSDLLTAEDLVESMARTFNMSRVAMNNRLTNLGVISDPH